jgi:hypothetical protein
MSVLALIQEGIEQHPAVEGAAAGSTSSSLFSLVIAVVVVASLWKVFAKAGEPGWAAIVPVYNLVVVLRIAQKPIWWIVLFFIPVANLVAVILTGIAIAQRFGKGTGFGVGVGLLPMVFYPLLAFGDARYQAAKAA